MRNKDPRREGNFNLPRFQGWSKWNQYCKHNIVIKKLTIVYHRQKNERDHSNPSSLLLPNNNTVTKIAAFERIKNKTKNIKQQRIN